MKRYHYGVRFRRWAIWDENGVKVMDYATREEAEAEVYRLNGWKKKTTKIKSSCQNQLN